MKVKVTEGSRILHEGKHYKAGDVIELEPPMLGVQVEAGIVEMVETKKGRRK